MNDEDVERAMLFQHYLNLIMTRYEELYKELTRNKQSQPLTTEFVF